MKTVLENALLPTYPTPRVEFVDGDGMWLTDSAGRRYLDFAAGIAVVGLGHRHPAPLAAAHAQLDRIWHSSNLYASEPAPALAQRLSDRFGGAQAFFCNSGAEANEAVLKYARKATGKPGVIALEQSFHGRTTGSLAVTGQPAKREAFEPLLPGARFAQPNDIASLHAAASDDVGLILVEPVLGEGGVIPLTPEFLEAAAALAAELGALLAFDEVQTGMGRTGIVLRVRAARRQAAARHAREGARERTADRRAPRRRRRGGRVRPRRPRLDLRRQPRRLRGGGRGLRHDRRRAACERARERRTAQPPASRR